jgi:hypothetical protein
MTFWSNVGNFFSSGFKKFSDAVLAPVFGSKIQNDGTLKANSKIADFSGQVVKSALPQGASGNLIKDASQFLTKGLVPTAQLLEKTSGDAIGMLEKSSEKLRSIPLVGDTIAAEAEAVIKPAKELLEASKEGVSMVQSQEGRSRLAEDVSKLAIKDPNLRRQISQGIRTVQPFSRDVARMAVIR